MFLPHLHLIASSGATNASELFGVNGKRVLTVLLQHRQRLLVIDLPHPVRVAWDPNFWESDELASCLASFVDKGDCLLDASFKIEPARLGGDSGGLILAERHSVG